MLGPIPQVGLCHVDGDRLPRKRRMNRPSMINQGNAKISGKEIAGSRGQHREGDVSVSQFLCRSANGAVAPQHDEQIRTRGNRKPNGPLTVVGRLRRKPASVLPTELLFFGPQVAPIHLNMSGVGLENNCGPQPLR